MVTAEAPTTKDCCRVDTLLPQIRVQPWVSVGTVSEPEGSGQGLHRGARTCPLPPDSVPVTAAQAAGGRGAGRFLRAGGQLCSGMAREARRRPWVSSLGMG